MPGYVSFGERHPQPPPLHVCPVCGYQGLEEPPVSDGVGSGELCDSCGYEFDGAAATDAAAYQAYRDQWVNDGMKWFGKLAGVPEPAGWNPQAQLDRLNSQNSQNPAA
jgi:rubredoxin